MENKVTLHAQDLDGFLTEDDKRKLDEIYAKYDRYLEICKKYDNAASQDEAKKLSGELSAVAREIGHALDSMTKDEKQIHVYSFETPSEQHAEASRLIAKLRDPKTGHEEFLYYIQRAYEMLFNHTYCDKKINNKRALIQETPVDIPCQNYAAHHIPDVDDLVHDSVMCVMLRGALLPSMIVSKEIQDYSSDDFITPFALFRIKRDETKSESNMAYVLDLSKSFFNIDELDGKDLVFADPMNATGGSLVTIVKYLQSKGIKPKSIKFLNVISALKGSLRIARAIPNAEVYTLWMDPVLNDKAYILPGLGDAGDRLNGVDGERPRNMIQLIADYGSSIVGLYRDQVREIENTVLSR